MDRFVVFTLMLLFSSFLSAFETSVETQYTLSANEDPVEAQSDAYRKLKVLATASLPSYTVREVTLEGSDLEQSIRTLGASITQLRDIEVSRRDKTSDGVQYEVRAKAVIDREHLKELISQLHASERKERAIASLAKENKRLRKALNSADPQNHVAGRDLGAAIGANLDAVSEVFAQGELVAISGNGARRFQQLKRLLDHSVISAFQQSTVSVSVSDVERVEGQRYRVSFDFSPSLDYQELTEVLSEAFTVVDRSKATGFLQVNNPLFNNQRAQAHDGAFKWLSSHRIDLVVRLGGRERRFAASFLKASSDASSCGSYSVIRHWLFGAISSQQARALCLQDPGHASQSWIRRDSLRPDGAFSMTVPKSLAEQAASVSAWFEVSRDSLTP